MVDFVGATFPSFEIRVNGTKYLTNENGICEIPKTEQFSFSYSKQNYLYHIKNNNLEAIDIKLGEISSAEIEGTFVLRKNEICKLGDNSNDLTCYRKLKKATEIKLFPPYSQ